MTDENVVESTVPNAIPESTTPETKTYKPNAQQLENMRPHLYNSILQEYRHFVTAIRSLPIKAESFLQALMHLDTGMLWAKEAIHHAEFIDKELQVVTTPTTVRIEPVPDSENKEKQTVQ